MKTKSSIGNVVRGCRSRSALHGYAAAAFVACLIGSEAPVAAEEALSRGSITASGQVVPVGCDCYPPPCVGPTPHYITPGPVTRDGRYVVPESSILREGEGVEGSPYELPAEVEGATGDAFAGMDGMGNDTAGGSQMPGGLGAVAAAQSPSVHMIGDFFGGGYFLGDGMGSFSTVPSSGGDRRFKATDNLNPMPQDRLFFNYHRFNDAVYDINNNIQAVNRYTVGMERTFFDNMMSLEVRVPIIGGLDNAQTLGSQNTTTSDFGNVSLTVKAFVCEIGCWSVLSGMAIVFPTASDATVDGSNLTLLENNAVHLQPYIGINYAHKCSRWFSTAYMAFDFDTNGNALFTSDPSGSGPPNLFFVDDVREQTLMFVDYQLGYWLYQDFGHIGYINGIAPVIELHYSRAIDDAYDGAPGLINNPFGKMEVLNLTGGLVFDIRRQATVTIYGATPLNDTDGELFGRTVSSSFDSEFGVQCVYRY